CRIFCVGLEFSLDGSGTAGTLPPFHSVSNWPYHLRSATDAHGLVLAPPSRGVAGPRSTTRPDEAWRRGWGFVLDRESLPSPSPGMARAVRSRGSAPRTSRSSPRSSPGARRRAPFG